jgi:hypothetical protein
MTQRVMEELLRDEVDFMLLEEILCSLKGVNVTDYRYRYTPHMKRELFWLFIEGKRNIDPMKAMIFEQKLSLRKSRRNLSFILEQEENKKLKLTKDQAKILKGILIKLSTVLLEEKDDQSHEEVKKELYDFFKGIGASEEYAKKVFEEQKRLRLPPRALQELLLTTEKTIDKKLKAITDQNSKQAKFLRWLRENVVLGTNIQRYGFIAVIIITAILILFLMSKIPVIGKLFKFLLKIIFLPLTLLVKGLTFILKKLGVMSSEEARQTINNVQQQKAAIV